MKGEVNFTTWENFFFPFSGVIVFKQNFLHRKGCCLEFQTKKENIRCRMIHLSGNWIHSAIFHLYFYLSFIHYSTFVILIELAKISFRNIGRDLKSCHLFAEKWEDKWSWGCQWWREWRGKHHCYKASLDS